MNNLSTEQIKNTILEVLIEFFEISDPDCDLDLIDVYGINSIDALYIFYLVEKKLNLPEILKMDFKTAAVSGNRTINKISEYIYNNKDKINASTSN